MAPGRLFNNFTWSGHQHFITGSLRFCTFIILVRLKITLLLCREHLFQASFKCIKAVSASLQAERARDVLVEGTVSVEVPVETSVEAEL